MLLRVTVTCKQSFVAPQGAICVAVQVPFGTAALQGTPLTTFTKFSLIETKGGHGAFANAAAHHPSS